MEYEKYVENERKKSDYLRDEARALFGEAHLKEMEDWYLETLEDKWEYVFFVVRRSYMLALLMEEITGKKMEECGHAVFLTDAAFILNCKRLADYYCEKKRFPQILLCDDALVHGRNINQILQQAEERLCEILGDKDSSVIRGALAEAVKIHVYVRADTQLLLLSRYEAKLKYARKEAQSVWRVLSSNISLLIMRSGMANASYIFSEQLSNEQFETIDLSNYTKSWYHTTRQYVYVDFVGSTPNKKAILTLRLIKDYRNKGYRAVPFVFLPNLRDEDTVRLLNEILKREEIKKYREWLISLYHLPGKRNFNEIVTLLLSHAVLQCFNRTYGFAVNEEESQEEIGKIARNYADGDSGEAKRILSDLVAMELFDGLEELKEMLDRCIPDEFTVICLDGEKDHSPGEIRKNFEIYFYGRGYSDEVEAFQLFGVIRRDHVAFSFRNARGCGFTLCELASGYTESDARMAMACFLQMMDAGILGLSSYAPYNINVVGMAQYAKAGEMALCLLPLRYYLYIPLLAAMQERCEQWMLSLEEEVKKYWRRSWPPELEGDQIDVGEIISLLEKLKRIGQFPQDWNGNYLSRKDFETDDMGELFGKRLQFIEKQKKLKYDYVKYAKL